MKNLKNKSKNSKLISFALPFTIDKEAVMKDSVKYDTDFEMELEMAEEVEEFSALWDGLTKNAATKCYQKLSGESHYSYKLDDEKVNAISEFQFTGFAKQIADTIVQKKAISEKQFEILAKEIFNHKY